MVAFLGSGQTSFNLSQGAGRLVDLHVAMKLIVHGTCFCKHVPWALSISWFGQIVSQHPVQDTTFIKAIHPCREMCKYFQRYFLENYWFQKLQRHQVLKIHVKVQRARIFIWKQCILVASYVCCFRKIANSSVTDFQKKANGSCQKLTNVYAYFLFT